MPATSTRTPRSYKKLSDEEFSQASEMWASGAHQLVEIADTFGVSVRSLQMRLAAAGVTKGEEKDAALAALPVPVLDAVLPSDDELPTTAAAMRARSYAAALKIEDAILFQLEVIRSDPSSAFKSNSTLKALFSASAALEKLHDLKSKALDLDRQPVEDLPALTVRLLLREEIEALQGADGDDDDYEEEIVEDDVVELGDLIA